MSKETVTLKERLNKDYPVNEFEIVFTNFLLDCITERFIEYEDSKIVDIKIVPKGNFSGYFKVSVRKQLSNIFDITTHMVYIANFDDLRDRYISTINVDFTKDDEDEINKNTAKITTLIDQISKLLKTIETDFICHRFYFSMREFHTDNEVQLEWKPITDNAYDAMYDCMDSLISRFVADHGFEKNSKINMCNEIIIKCNLTSLGIESQARLVFNIIHSPCVDMIYFCIMSIPSMSDSLDALESAFDNPNSKFSKGGICMTIIEAEKFGQGLLDRNKYHLDAIDEYVNSVANEVDTWITKLSNDHNITINMNSEVN